MNKNKAIRIALGAFLSIGAIAGAIGTLEGIDGYFSDDDYLRGIAYILYLITFIYIGVIGFRLSGNFGDVTKQAKWTFALQTPIFNIPHSINWSWSTGIGANIGFIDGQLLIEMPQLQVPDIYFLYPDDTFGIGLNLAAFLFAYLLHLLGKQSLNGQNSAMQKTPAIAANAQTSEDLYVQAYQELQSKTQDIATWAKALASSNGDNDVAEATYLRVRVELLQSKAALQPRELASKIDRDPDPDALRAPAVKSHIGIALKTLAIGTALGGVVFTLLIALQDGKTDLGVSLILGTSLSALMMLTLIIFSLPVSVFLPKFKAINWRYSILISVLFCAPLAYGIALVLDYGDLNHVKINVYELLAYFATFLCCCLVFISRVLMSVYRRSESAKTLSMSFKNKLATGIGAVLIATALVLFGSGTLKLNVGGESTQDLVEASSEQLTENDLTQITQQLSEAKNYEEMADRAKEQLMCYENFNNGNYAIALQKCHAIALKFDDPTAQKWLGYMYADGNGTEKDIPKAIDWLLKAAHQGEVLAELKLGEIYDTTFESNIYKDDKKALDWYMKAAQHGLSVAQFEVGVMYYRGLGVNKDEQKAVEWLRKAADQGLVSAKESLANMGY